MHLRHLEHLRGERDDLHVVAVAQLARHGAEDARPARVPLVVDEHGRVLVEADVAAVGATELLGRTHDDRAHDITFLDCGIRDRLLDAGDDDVTNRGRRLLRAAQDADALNDPRSSVVSDLEPTVLLNHLAASATSASAASSARSRPGCAAAWIASV